MSLGAEPRDVVGGAGVAGGETPLQRIANAVWAPLLFGLRLWGSVCLALFVAFWLQLDTPFWAGTSAAIVCQPQLGASLRKGWFRLIGTVIGALFIVFLTAVFPQNRLGFLLGLALWGAACALAATLLRNYVSYAASLAGYTAAIIATDQLGSVGGPNGQAFTLAIARATEICIGIVSAGVVLAGTDFGGARRRLAALFASLADEIAADFVRMVSLAATLPETQAERRELVRRVASLDPVVDQVLGESSQLRAHSGVLQDAVDGLFMALSGWRAVAVCLGALQPDEAGREARGVMGVIPAELGATDDPAAAARIGPWIAHPSRLRRQCEAAMRRLIAMRVPTPSLRLLADETAVHLSGLGQALRGIALLVEDPDRPLPRRARFRLRVADPLPAWLNAGRAFIAIVAMQGVWIITGWPGGAAAFMWTAITVILFAARADQAYAAAMSFFIGTIVAAVFAAILSFAVLPKLTDFVELSLALGVYLVPAAALMAWSPQTGTFTAMTANLVPLVAPANQMSYDPAQFYNSAAALIAGLGAGVLAFRLIPPLSPGFRTQRLLVLTLRDLRRLVRDPRPLSPVRWEAHLYGRLEAMPDQAEALQRGWLVAALSVGTAIIRLRHPVQRLGFAAELEAALRPLADGQSAEAVARLSSLDQTLAAVAQARGRPDPALRARGAILAIAEALKEHSAYFDAEAPA